MEEMYKVLKRYLGDKKNCILCGGNKFSLWARLYYLKALKCTNCGMVSTNPHINEEGLKIFYSLYFKNRLENKKLFKDREKMYKLEYNFISNFISRGKVLDLGCSGGFFLNVFCPSRWKRKGIDIDVNATNYAKRHFGIDVLNADLPRIDFGKEKFDLVILRGVIEHCIDPTIYLKKCRSILRHRGLLFISATPNIESFCAEVYREKWRLFTPIEHIHFFSVNLLNRILNPMGFEFLEKKYFYDETPYANLIADYKKFKKDLLLIIKGQRHMVKQSGPFWGNMITGIWVFNK